MKSVNQDPAVSPIIGTILLVAIAFVFTSIILAVVMGLSGEPSEKKVGLNVKSASGNNAILLLYKGESIPDLVRLEMIDQDSPYGEYVEVWNADMGPADVGIPYPADDVAQPASDMDTYQTKINVRGIFSDGKDLILLVQPITFHNVLASSKAPAVPTVYAPTVTNIGLSSADFEVRYKGMNETPASWTIYCNPVDKNRGREDVILGSDLTGTEGSFSNLRHYNLVIDTNYEVWGEVVMKNGEKITGPKTTFTTAATTFSAPYLTTENGNTVIRVDFWNLRISAAPHTYIRVTKPSGSVVLLQPQELKMVSLEKNSPEPYHLTGYYYIDVEDTKNVKYYLYSGQTYEMRMAPFENMLKVTPPSAMITIP